jgi:hypothetical protein
MFNGLVQEFIDSNFLARETGELGRLNSQLKGAVNLNRATLAQLQKDIESHHRAIDAAANQRRQVESELEALDQNKSMLWREVSTLRDRHGSAVVALSEAETQLATRQGELKRLAAEGHRAIEAEHRAKSEGLAAEHRATVEALEAELTDRRTELASMATEAQDKAKDVSGLTQELNRLTAALTQAETRFSEKQVGLLRTYETALGQHRAKLEALETAAIERGEALDSEIQNRQNRIVELQAQFDDLKAQVIAEGELHIDIARRQFENEQAAAFNQLEAERIAVHKDLTLSQEALIQKYRPMIEAPLLEELRQTQIEVGRVHKKLAEKAGDDLVWNADQIREFLLDIDADGDAPSHLRICGATKSGKSFLVNQIISGGLKSLGFDAAFTVIDPYSSQTKWATPPTVRDDPEAAYKLILEWAAACDGSPLPRPAVLVVDELDSLISDYGESLSEAIKKIIKRGRHNNRFFYWLGQSGNCPKKFQWTDIKNFNQIYLGTVADDYSENGLKGRNKNRWLGELEALRDKSKYHALIHEKGCNPYTRLLPKNYFTAAPSAPSATPGATTEPGLQCPKCGSGAVKKAGWLNDRQRVKCHDCNKQSFAEG